MAWIETQRADGPGDGMSRTQPLREAVTRAAAAGFLVGGLARLVFGGALDLHPLMLRAAYLALGAIAAAIVVGILVNLIVLPLLRRFAPGQRLPDAAYRVAGTLSALAAFLAAILALPYIGE